MREIGNLLEIIPFFNRFLPFFFLRSQKFNFGIQFSSTPEKISERDILTQKTDASIDLNPSLPYTDCDGQDEQQKNHGAGKEKNERRGDRHRTESESSFRRDGRWESLKVPFLLDQTGSERRFRRDESREGASLHDRTGSESSFRTRPESVFRRKNDQVFLAQ